MAYQLSFFRVCACLFSLLITSSVNALITVDWGDQKALAHKITKDEKTWSHLCQVQVFRHEKLINSGNAVFVTPDTLLTLKSSLKGYRDLYPYRINIRCGEGILPVVSVVDQHGGDDSFTLLFLTKTVSDVTPFSFRTFSSARGKECLGFASWGPSHRVSAHSSHLWNRQNYDDFWGVILSEDLPKKYMTLTEDAYDIKVFSNQSGVVAHLESKYIGLEDSDKAAPLFDAEGHLIGLAMGPQRGLIESDLYQNARKAMEESVLKNYGVYALATAGAASVVWLSVNQIDLISFVKAEILSYVMVEFLNRMIKYTTRYTSLDELLVSPYHFANYVTEKKAERGNI